MTWKDILKEIRMDKDVSCCEEARTKIVEWFEEHIDSKDITSAKLKTALITTQSDLSEESCEDLYDSVIRFMEMYDLERSEFFDYQSLRDIMDDWNKCKEEPEMEKPKPSVREDYGLKAKKIFESDLSEMQDWMNNYIRSGSTFER